MPFGKCPKIKIHPGRSLGRFYVDRHFAFLARCDFKLHPLAFFQGAISLHFNFGMMYKQIFSPAVGRNKTKALFLVKPLDCTAAHCILLGSCRPANQSVSLLTSNKVRPEGKPRTPLTSGSVKQRTQYMSSRKIS